ncbi:MAG: hypothetical protein L6R36_002126 [Xanthoria steineri]|nr:MAG: hypothetical protein L6R36_002126 [Xanthoria steineri]
MEEKEPQISHNPMLQRYYAAWESRLGYRLVMGGTRHFGYHPLGTTWPLPLGAVLRRMEDHLYQLLELPTGSKVLDAGCGNRHVALQLARKGLRVQGIDIVANHIRWARQEIKAQKMENMVSARVADYHHLDWVPDMSFDGVCTMENFVHAREPEQVLSEFFRILKPGGSIAMHEYWHLDDDELPPGTPKDLSESIKRVDRQSAMPTDRRLRRGVLQQVLKDQGFVEVVEKDLSRNISPTLLLFYVLGYIPYLIICFFGLQAWFVNTGAGVQGYRGLQRQLWGYTAGKAKKPLETIR